jgi:hypothetical protein
MALTAASATSGGGLAAFAMSKFCRKKKTNQTRGKQNETRNGSERNESLHNRVIAGVRGLASATAREGEGVWHDEPYRS